MKNIFIPFLIVLLLFACEKQESKQYTSKKSYYKYVPYSDYLLPYKFKQGSNWTYSKIGTLEKDSVVLENAFVENCESSPCFTHGGIADTCRQEVIYYMYLSSSYYHEANYLCLHRTHISSIGQYCQDFPIFSPNYVLGDTIYKLYELEDSMSITIGANTFSNVSKMQCLGAAASVVLHSPAHNAIIYVAPNIGIVRKEIEINPGVFNTWELVKFTIIQ